MSMCDRCVDSLSCCLNVNGKACKERRKRLCPDVVYSNADRIRDMDDEELAAVIMCPMEIGGSKDLCAENHGYTCVECSLRWLQEPAKEE